MLKMEWKDLESVFGAARICGVATEDFVKMQTENIRNIFKLQLPSIKEGRKSQPHFVYALMTNMYLKKKIFFQNATTMLLSVKN